MYTFLPPLELCLLTSGPQFTCAPCTLQAVQYLACMLCSLHALDAAPMLPMPPMLKPMAMVPLDGPLSGPFGGNNPDPTGPSVMLIACPPPSGAANQLPKDHLSAVRPHKLPAQPLTKPPVPPGPSVMLSACPPPSGAANQPTTCLTCCCLALPKPARYICAKEPPTKPRSVSHRSHFLSAAHKGSCRSEAFTRGSSCWRRAEPAAGEPLGIPPARTAAAEAADTITAAWFSCAMHRSTNQTKQAICRLSHWAALLTAQMQWTCQLHKNVNQRTATNTATAAAISRCHCPSCHKVPIDPPAAAPAAAGRRLAVLAAAAAAAFVPGL